MSTQRLMEQADHIDTFISNRKYLDKWDGVPIGGDRVSNERIIKAINGELKNVHNYVFKKCLGKKQCEECNESKPLDRAHTKSRPEIAKEVLNRIHPELTETIDMKIFFTAFIVEHKKYGVWMLCRECHKKLG